MRTFAKPPARRGFTIIELLAVIAAALIVLALVAAAYLGGQRHARDLERKRDIAALRIALEGYYGQTQHYPLRANLNSQSWRAAHLKALPAKDLRDPGAKTHVRLAAKPAPRVYAYQPAAVRGKACDNQTSLCTQYTLTATLERGGRYVKQNLH
jgi:prepilin-type N-terminal cleavage/methylation domain-containing protein